MSLAPATVAILVAILPTTAFRSARIRRAVVSKHLSLPIQPLFFGMCLAIVSLSAGPRGLPHRYAIAEQSSAACAAATGHGINNPFDIVMSWFHARHETLVGLLNHPLATSGEGPPHPAHNGTLELPSSSAPTPGRPGPVPLGRYQGGTNAYLRARHAFAKHYVENMRERRVHAMTMRIIRGLRRHHFQHIEWDVLIGALYQYIRSCIEQSMRDRWAALDTIGQPSNGDGQHDGYGGDESGGPGGSGNIMTVA